MRKCQVYYCVPFKAHKNTTAGRVVEFIRKMCDDYDGDVDWRGMEYDENFVYFDMGFPDSVPLADIESVVGEMNDIDIDHESARDRIEEVEI